MQKIYIKIEFSLILSLWHLKHLLLLWELIDAAYSHSSGTLDSPKGVLIFSPDSM